MTLRSQLRSFEFREPWVKRPRKMSNMVPYQVTYLLNQYIKAQTTQRTRIVKLVSEPTRRLGFLDLLQLSCSPLDLFYTPCLVLHIDTPCLHTKPNIFPWMSICKLHLDPCSCNFYQRPYWRAKGNIFVWALIYVPLFFKLCTYEGQNLWLF